MGERRAHLAGLLAEERVNSGEVAMQGCLRASEHAAVVNLHCLAFKMHSLSTAREI